MKDLLSILRDAPGSIRLEVSGEDLLAFSKSLIDRAKEELNVLKIEMEYTDLATLWSSFNAATDPTPIKVQLAVKISDDKGNSAMTDFADVVIVNL